MPRVSRYSIVAGTSRRDLAPEHATSMGDVTSAMRSAECPAGRDSRDGRHRFRLSHEPDADLRATVRTPPRWSRRSRRTAHAARSRGPTFRVLESTARARSRPGRSGCARRARRWLPASRPPHAPRPPSRGPPRRRGARGTRVPRWSSRGRRPAVLVECGANLVRELDELAHAGDATGIAPTCCTQRAAASSASSGPPTIQPAASASPAPVESRARGTGSASRSSLPNEHPRAPCLRIQSASTSDGRRRAPLPRSRTRVWLEGAHALAERLDAAVADRAPRRQIDADPSTCGASEPGACEGPRPAPAPPSARSPRRARDRSRRTMPDRPRRCEAFGPPRRRPSSDRLPGDEGADRARSTLDGPRASTP